MAKYDGWVLKNKWGSFVSYFFAERRRDVAKRIGSLRWEAWRAEEHKIVKVKFVEVK